LGACSAFSPFFSGVDGPENGALLDSPNDFRIEAAGKTVENGEKRSENG